MVLAVRKKIGTFLELRQAPEAAKDGALPAARARHRCLQVPDHFAADRAGSSLGGGGCFGKRGLMIHERRAQFHFFGDNQRSFSLFVKKLVAAPFWWAKVTLFWGEQPGR